MGRMLTTIHTLQSMSFSCKLPSNSYQIMAPIHTPNRGPIRDRSQNQRRRTLQNTIIENWLCCKLPSDSYPIQGPIDTPNRGPIRDRIQNRSRGTL
jgi:hypothetical protein